MRYLLLTLLCLITLHSHAHLDHVGSIAELQLATGAKIATNAESAVLAERGGKDDVHFADRAQFPAAKTDRFLPHPITCKTYATNIQQRLLEQLRKK